MVSADTKNQAKRRRVLRRAGIGVETGSNAMAKPSSDMHRAVTGAIAYHRVAC